MIEVFPKIVHPGEGEVLHAFGEQVTLLQSGKDTGGAFAKWIETTPPGGGPPPHYHTNEDEWFYTLEGRVEFFLDGSWTEVPPGTSVFMPRNVLHTFRNCGDQPLKMLIHTAPSGFDVFFRRCADVFAEPGPPDMDRIMQISAEHGIHFVTS
ncbi:MAG: cupin domain-containing protein [Verrucomicrobiae bacterium]|nr:cupin domain-containing protein [Verrucomicrobiae bacterium]